MDELEKSLNDEATFAGAAKRRPAAEMSLGDERTLGDRLGDQDTVIDDIEVVDLEARYKVEGTLGQGGMGAVLLATDTRLGRKVAIKRILGEAARSKTAIMRFLTEAKAIAALNHPNIVQIYDYGRAKDGPFLIMEYVDGGSLLDRCREAAIPLEQVVDLACQLCDGLGLAHEQGVVHRDIKPANILLSKSGLPKLTDFGLAKAQSSDHGQTMTGAVLGTPDFMPPEQRRDASEVDSRSDLWSLAATVYQMVTGRSPKIIRFDLLPPHITKVLGKALEDSKNDRYQTAREFRDALKSAARKGASAHSATMPGEGECPACGVQNDPSRRFCRSCGTTLEAPCLSCDKPMPMWEEICGSCGAKQTPIVEQHRDQMANAQAQAEGLLSDFLFDKAAELAAGLRDQPHPRLVHLKEWATDFLIQVERTKTEQVSRAQEAIHEALSHDRAYDYAAGVRSLVSIPEILRESVSGAGRRETAAAMLSRLESKLNESTSLDAEIRDAIKNKALPGLLPKVIRLAQLRPDRTDVIKVRQQLDERLQRLTAKRDELYEQAREAFRRQDYATSLQLFSQIDAEVMTDAISQFGDTASYSHERSRMLLERIKSDVADQRYDGLLENVEEYLTLKPTTADLEKLRSRLTKRAERLQAEKQAHDKRMADEQRAQAARRVRVAGIIAPIVAVIVLICLLAEMLYSYRHLSLSQMFFRIQHGGPNSLVIGRVMAAGAAWACTWWLTPLVLAKYESLPSESRALIRSLLRKGAAVLVVLGAAALCVGGFMYRREQLRTRAADLAEAVQRKDWSKALSLDPDSVEAYIGRADDAVRPSTVGEIWRVDRRSETSVDAAIGDLDEAEKRDPRAAGIRSVRARAFLLKAKMSADRDDLEDAEQWLAKGVALGPSEQEVAYLHFVLTQKWVSVVEKAVAACDADGCDRALRAAKAHGAKASTLADLSARFGHAAALRQDASLMKRAAGIVGAYGNSPHAVSGLEAGALIIEATALEKRDQHRNALVKVGEAFAKNVAAAASAIRGNEVLRDAVVSDDKAKCEEAIAQSRWEDSARHATVMGIVDPHPAAWVTEIVKAIPEIRNSIGIRMRLLPGGVFTMGQDGGESDETPHQVTLTKPFYVGIHEVTNDEWKQVMGNVPSEWKDDDRPVTNVSWEDAARFCQKLSALPEEQKAGRVYRLPTEAEWEYACRAGTDTKYSFGDYESRLSEYGWFGGNYSLDSQTHPVGKKKPNGWGLFDMHGNVWEWCSDWYGDYPDGAVTDPQGPSSASARVRRGGGWNSAAGLCRSADRNLKAPADRNNYLGFRLALTLTGDGQPEAGARIQAEPRANRQGEPEAVHTPPKKSISQSDRGMNDRASTLLPSATGEDSMVCPELGVECVFRDGDWTGRWVRRGSTNVFDAEMLHGAAQETANYVATIEAKGGVVHISRDRYRSTRTGVNPPGGRCDWTGSLSDDGKEIRWGAQSFLRIAE